MFPLCHVKKQQKGACLQTGKRVLSRYQIGWHVDLELPSLYNCEK